MIPESEDLPIIGVVIGLGDSADRLFDGISAITDTVADLSLRRAGGTVSAAVPPDQPVGQWRQEVTSQIYDAMTTAGAPDVVAVRVSREASHEARNATRTFWRTLGRRAGRLFTGGSPSPSPTPSPSNSPSPSPSKSPSSSPSPGPFR